MDLNKIHYFFKAVELKNFTKAANECNVAQTTMSKYISVLEQELGVCLFIREHKNLILTVQGQIFYEKMKDIDGKYRELCELLKQKSACELRIGIVTTDYTDFKVIQSFEKKYPDIAISFAFFPENQLLSDLQTQKIDALICPDMLSFYQRIEEQIEAVPLVSNKVSLVCSKELLSRYGTIENLICHAPFITKAKEKDYHNFIKDEIYKQFNCTFQDVKIVSEYPKQLLLLNLSHGFSILPITKNETSKNLMIFDFKKRFKETEILIYLKNNQSSSLKSLLEHIHEKKC